MAVMVNVRVIEHDLPAASQFGAVVGLALDEAVDQAALEILRAGPVRELEPGIAYGPIDAVDVERVLHDAMTDAVAAARARPVAHEHDLRLDQLYARGARRNRREEVEVLADLIGARHWQLSQGHGDPERRGAVGDAHRVVDLAGDGVTPPLRVLDPVDGEQRRLGLHVVHVLRVLDARVLHRGPHALRDDLHHARSADVLGLQLCAHGGSYHQACLGRRARAAVPSEHGGVRGDDAVTTSRPHHGNRGDFRLAARAVLRQHPTESLVGEESREVVDASVSFGFPYHGDHLFGGELAGAQALLQAGGILHALQLDLCHFDGHRRLPELGLVSIYPTTKGGLFAIAA